MQEAGQKGWTQMRFSKPLSQGSSILIIIIFLLATKVEKQLLSSLIFNITLVINEKPLKTPSGRNMRLLKCGLGRSGEIIYIKDLSEKLQLDFKKKSG